MVNAHVYRAAPFSFVLMIGSAVPTTVWSSANRNSASRIASRISSFWRWGRAQVGCSMLAPTAAACDMRDAPAGAAGIPGGGGPGAGSLDDWADRPAGRSFLLRRVRIAGRG